MLLYIIRHGHPTYNPDELTPLGKRQAEAVAHRMAEARIDEVYSSPLNRARQTAQPTYETLCLPCRIEDWTSEAHAAHDFGVTRDGQWHWCFDGVQPYLRSHPEYFGEIWYEAPCLGENNFKEGFRRVQEASDEFLARQGYVRSGGVYRAERDNAKHIAVFCHAGFGSLWISHLLGFPPTVYWATMDLTHTGITVFRLSDHACEETTPVMLTHSDTSHLFEARLPMYYNNDIPF